MAYVQDLDSVDFSALAGGNGEIPPVYSGPAVGVASTGGASAVTRNGSRGPGGPTAAAPTSTALPVPNGGPSTVLPPAAGGSAAAPGLAATPLAYYARAATWDAAMEMYLTEQHAQPPQWNAWQSAANGIL